MKILVVEDDPVVAHTLELLLANFNYAVDVAADGDTGLQMADAFDYDLVVLDVGLPGLDGIAVCQHLRANGFQHPVLLLTGQGDGRQKAIALNAGADDYVVKPFDAEELIARVQALLRRGGPTSQPVLTFGPLSVDPSSRKVTYGTQLLTIAPKEYAILELFLRTPQHVYSASTILNHVWASLDAPGEETVRAHIKELRHKLTAVGAPKDLIKTNYGVGYQLNPSYASLRLQVTEQLSSLHMAELHTTNEELQTTLKQLRLSEAELQRKNQALERAYQTIEQDRHRLQAACNELELRVAERTAELVATSHSQQRQQAQWQAVLNHALDAIALADDQGKYVEVNPAACDLFGVDKATLLQSSMANFVDPAVDLEHLWHQFLHQQQMVRELCLHRPDGTMRATEFHAIANIIPGRHLCIWRDISDRNRLEAEQRAAQASLRDSEERYRLVFESNPNPMWFFDPETLAFLEVNQAATDVYGYSRDEFLQMTLSDIRPPASVTVLLEATRKVRPGQPHAGVWQNCRKDGTVIDVEVTIYSFSVTGQQVDLALIKDITELKRLEAEQQKAVASMHEAHQQIVTIWESMTDAYTTVDREWRIVYTNPTALRIFCQLTHQAPDAILGQRLWDVFPWAIGQPMEHEYRRAMAEQVAVHLDVLYEPTGTWFEIHAYPSAVGLGIYFRDISDRKRTELEIRQFVSLANNSTEFIGMCDLNFVPFYVNPAGLQLLGLDDVQTFNETPVKDFFFPEDQDFIINEFFPQVLREGHAEVEIRFRHFKTGEALWMVYSVSYIQDEADQPIGLATFSRNITDRKQTELMLQHQLLREQLISDIAQDIRRSLDLNDVLSRTVTRVRATLSVDRVIIFRFRSDCQGEVIMEAVGAEWTPLLSTIISDSCFRERYITPYQQGHIAASPDIHQEKLEPYYAELLHQFQVRARLVVPIFQAERLWGLLIAHQCSGSRQWHASEIDLLRQLATQVGIAIQQSELYEQTRQELLVREQMQAVLEESEERFRTLSAAAPIGICQTNTDGICLYTNLYWQNMSGHCVEDSLGSGWLQAIHPDDRTAFKLAWEAYLRSEQGSLPEVRLLTPQGDIRWVVAQIAAMKSVTGETVGYVSTYEDITERKQAEAALRTSERRLQTILDHSPAVIYILDAQNRHLLTNRSYASLLSTTPEQLVGQSIYEVWPPDFADTFAANNRLVVETGQLLQIEEVAPHADGLHTYITVKFPLYDATGTFYALCGISTDITEKKQLEIQFYRAQRLESLGTLASGIAHDLNNVLTPIVSISQLLRMKQQPIDARSQELLKILEDSAKRGANMIKQILTFTRGTDGERSPLQIGPLVEEVIKVVQQTFPKSINIHSTTPTHTAGVVFADATYLHQVLMNLCVNARDAMPDGGTLSLSVDHCSIDQAFAQTNLEAQVGNYVVITVADTGTGIPLELRERIFDPFFTTKAVGQGTGLGLATVLGIVKSYGGFLQIFSEVEQGTQIKVYLPVMEGFNLSSSQPHAQLGGSGELILLVDDDVAVQHSTQSLLESHHYTVVSANNGIEAMQLYAQHQRAIQLVILDMMMPHMSGVSLAQQLRQTSTTIKIIAMSGLPSNREPALAAGANAFLAKPYLLEDLLATVQALITHP